MVVSFFNSLPKSRRFTWASLIAISLGTMAPAWTVPACGQQTTGRMLHSTLPQIGETNQRPAHRPSALPEELGTPASATLQTPNVGAASAQSGQTAPTDIPDSLNSYEHQQASQPQLSASGIATINLCTVILINRVELPANQPGPIKELKVREGQTVAANEHIAQIDDQEATTALSVAAAKLDASEFKVASDIAIRYAQAGYNAAEKSFARARTLEARGAGKEIDVEEAQLKMIQSRLQTEKAQHDFQVDQKSVVVEKLEVLRARELVQRHSVFAPWGGTVREIFKQEGEWVNEGEPILEMIQLDRLWVEGRVHIREINPYQMDNRPARISLALANGEIVTFDGKIVLVDPEVLGGAYMVRAEVANRAFQGHWLLIPGMNVRMEVDVLPANGVTKPASHQQNPPKG